MTDPTDLLVSRYLDALAAADAEAVVALFTEDGVVHSPLYGPLPATTFYPALFADTSAARLTLRSTMTGVDAAGARTVAFWFHFDWRLPSGAAAPFEVVDVATLAADGRIRELRIVYDTVERPPGLRGRRGAYVVARVVTHQPG